MTTLNNFWDKLSPRERNLAIAAATAVTLVTLFFCANKAYTRISELNENIESLEHNLLYYIALEARSGSVDRAYQVVAAEHSSEWSAAEIHDRLRREIYRLAQKDPQAAPGTVENLVEIPRLQTGVIKDSDLGYREYQLTIKVPPKDINSIMTFLVRLQASQQSLRIDGLELVRAPDGTQVGATIQVTRTIVDGVPASPEGGQPAPAAVTSLFDWDGAAVEPWQATNVNLSIVDAIGEYSPDGGTCLLAVPTGPGASASVPQTLQAGTTYELSVDIASSAPVILGLQDAETNAVFEGSRETASDGRLNRYSLLFTVPGDSGSVKLNAPYLVFTNPDVQVHIDDVILREALQ